MRTLPGASSSARNLSVAYSGFLRTTTRYAHVMKNRGEIEALFDSDSADDEEFEQDGALRKCGF